MLERAEEYKMPAIHVRAVPGEMPNTAERTGTLKIPATSEWRTCAN